MAAALLLGRLAAQLGRRDLSLPVSLAYLLWPSIAFMAPLAYKEGLIVALLLAMIVALIEQSRTGGFRWAILSGMAGGSAGPDPAEPRAAPPADVPSLPAPVRRLLALV